MSTFEIRTWYDADDQCWWAVPVNVEVLRFVSNYADTEEEAIAGLIEIASYILENYAKL